MLKKYLLSFRLKFKGVSVSKFNVDLIADWSQPLYVMIDLLHFYEIIVWVITGTSVSILNNVRHGL